ncbi:MAG TPA: response regulator transcription factor [Chitinophagaceae bacterium]|nr:response regulator transcription factor [Chitinophagaceae bacterium]
MDEIRILLVEDEKKIASALKSGMEEQGFYVVVAYDGTMGEKFFTNYDFDLVILDINLPDINGYTLSRIIRRRKQNIPILMLTALGTVEDKIEGFEAGADDYLVKPFAFKELLARIKSLLRRTAAKLPTSHILRVADLEINLDNREVRRSGNRISLTAKEFQLLEYLVRNKNRVVSRADIAGKVWDIGFDTGTNVIDVYINFLRKKIDKDYPVKLIQTQIGMGYILKEES